MGIWLGLGFTRDEDSHDFQSTSVASVQATDSFIPPMNAMQASESTATICSDLRAEQFDVDVDSARLHPISRETVTGGQDCQVTVQVMASTSVEGPLGGNHDANDSSSPTHSPASLLPDGSTCQILVAPVEPTAELVGLQGASVRVMFLEAGGCQEQLSYTIEIRLAPPQASAPLGRLGFKSFSRMSASFYAYYYMQIVGRITGVDCCTIDMVWNMPHLGWWQNGTYSDYGNWWETDGKDPFWELGAGYTPFNTTSRWVWEYYALHSRGFSSDGFPIPWLAPDLSASTRVDLHGYADGSAACSSPTHSYVNAQFYPLLHWNSFECYYEASWQQ